MVSQGTGCGYDLHNHFSVSFARVQLRCANCGETTQKWNYATAQAGNVN